MATKEELEKKIDKFEVNMTRTDRIVNGAENEDVRVDDGQLVPSIRKWQKEMEEEYGVPAELVVRAEEAASQAEGFSQEAEEHKQQAEAASNAAFVNADVKVSIEAGLTGPEAVAVGEQFQVLSADGFEYRRYRKDSETVAVEVGDGFPTPASIEGAESRTKAYVDEKAIQVSDEYLFRLIDKNEKVVAEIDFNSELHLTGLNDSVQNLLDTLLSSIAKNSSPEHIEVLLDSQQMVVRKQTTDGSLYLVGLSNSVQQEILELKDRPSGGSAVKITDKARELHNPVLISGLMASVAGGVEFAPLALELSPSRYSIGKDWMGKSVFSTTPDQSYVALDTPYNEDDGVVHPYIIEIPDTFRGYRYLMVITPYPGMDDQFENPVVYGSNDLLSFDMLDGMPQPLAGPPASQYGGYNYDPYFAYDVINGELLCIWATVELQSSGGPGAGLKCLYARRTKDGFSWSEAEQITEKTTESERSSCILFNSNDGYYYMYYTPNANEFSFKRSRTLSIDGWSDKVTIDTSSLGVAFWHLECKCVGDRVVVLLNDFNSSGNLYWGVSEPDDWTKFSFDATPVIADRSSIASKYSSSGVRGAYKASFLPNLNDGRLSFTILWTPAGSIGLGRKLFINQTSWYGV